MEEGDSGDIWNQLSLGFYCDTQGLWSRSLEVNSQVE